LSAATASVVPRSIAESLEDAMAKTILAAGVAALMFMSAAASAADFAPYAPTPPRGTSWQGPYVGGNVGYQWSHVDNNGAKPNGVAGGIQAGYNVQYSQFVFGGETDLQLTDADARFAAWKFSNPWFGSLRARAGFAVNNVLFYGTVGLAYGMLKIQNPLTNVMETHISPGWAGGAGAEVALLSNWSARAEYLYVDLGSSSFVLDSTNHGIQSSLLRLGINYRF
jgi:outer membrane immunogenic protein